MTKIVLDKEIIGGYSLSKINNNFSTIEDTINNKLLYKTQEEDNVLESNLDLNNNNIINVGSLKASDVVVNNKSLTEAIENAIEASESAVADVATIGAYASSASASAEAASSSANAASASSSSASSSAAQAALSSSSSASSAASASSSLDEIETIAEEVETNATTASTKATEASSSASSASLSASSASSSKTEAAASASSAAVSSSSASSSAVAAAASAEEAAGYADQAALGQINSDWNATTGKAQILNKPDLNNLSASQITSGVFDLARIPQAALERLVTVADTTARYALTSSQVQEGDVVKEISTGLMYFVVDVSNLNNASGYVEFTAGSASSVPWSGVTGKPNTLTGYGITVDSVPTDNSTNPVTSAGIKAAIAAKDSLPDQANNSGKYLKTDGTEASWEPTVSTTITYWE